MAAQPQQQQHNVNYKANILESLENEFRVIENMDPSCSEGFAIVYDREVPFELRPCQLPPSSPSASVAAAVAGGGDRSSSVATNGGRSTNAVSFPPHGTPQPQAGGPVQPSTAGAIEGIRVKIVTQNSGGSSTATSGLTGAGPCHSMRIELCSDADLFFNYNCVINHIGFNALREHQKLTCDFNEFTVMLMRLFNQAIRDASTHLCVMIFQPDGRAHLQILQNLQYKFVELVSLPFHEIPEEESRRHINYRYNAIRARLAIMTAKLQDVTALIKVKETPDE